MNASVSGHDLDTHRQVLVVEDDPHFERLVRRAAATMSAPTALRCCRTGAEALDALSDTTLHLDAALVDLGLPDVGGIDVIRVARDLRPGLPVMVLSVLSSERSVLDAVRAGARGYVLKDADEQAVARALEQVIRGEYPISPAIARHLFDVARDSLRAGGPTFGLTGKESELLEHIAWGSSYAEAAERMNVSVSTVQTHIRNLYRKLEVHSRAEAVAKARDHGLL